jgi:hypothetical protein
LWDEVANVNSILIITIEIFSKVTNNILEDLSVVDGDELDLGINDRPVLDIVRGYVCVSHHVFDSKAQVSHYIKLESDSIFISDGIIGSKNSNSSSDRIALSTKMDS